MWGSFATTMQFPDSKGHTMEYFKYSQTLPKRTVQSPLPGHLTVSRRPVYGSYGHINDIGNLEDKIRRLESDKDSLILQSNVLGEQVDAQTEKIIELETILRERGSRLEGAANMLHTEELSRRALETHKLDLMAEISSLKLKLATAEKTRRDADERYLHSQRQIEQLQCRLNDRTVEVGELRVKMKNGTIPGSFDSSGNYSENYNLYPGVKLRQSYHGTFPGSFPGSSATARLGDGYSSYNGSFNSGRTLDKDRTIDRLRRKHAEVDKLKKAVEALAEANEEKDRSLDEMRKVLRRYKKLEEFMFSGHGRQAMDGIRLLEDELSDSSRQTSGSSDSGRDARRMRQDMPQPNATSTPGNHVNLMSPVSEDHTLTVTPPSTIMSPTRSPGRLSPNERLGSGSNDVFFPRTPPASARRRLEASTLPKDHRPISPIKSQIQSLPRKKGFASFGKGFFKLRTGKWSTSAPNLDDQETDPSSDDEAEAETEGEEDDLKNGMAKQYKAMQEQKEVKEKKKAKGFRRFFGRLKRSNSQDLEKENLEEFKRSGLRATAGARLGWSRDLKFEEQHIPFNRWDRDRIAAWLHSMGLSPYIGNCNAYIKNGGQLLQANMHDLEKELGIRNHYHRKKLYLALRAMQSSTQENFGDLDHNWVTRWLDDIGLPQYKDQFSEARIDGRMLHNLTVEELVGLKVTNCLHHVSIKRGIHVLRMNNFQSACLQRRPADEGPLQNCASDVMLWTNHRVMEWLRTVDLSEYASNLRGSGVHGALMVLEPRFTAVLFSALLSIPKDKTLLRRHLNTHFVGLIGSETQHVKREFELSSDYAPLTPSTKVKLSKRGLFKHKRTKSEQNWEDFVCPINVQCPLQTRGPQQSSMRQTTRNPPRRNGSLPRNFDNRNLTAARDLDICANDINILTDLLAKDNFLERVPASDV